MSNLEGVAVESRISGQEIATMWPVSRYARAKF